MLSYVYVCLMVFVTVSARNCHINCVDKEDS